MITKERLKKLEEKRATIYFAAFEQVLPLDCGVEWNLNWNLDSDYEEEQFLVDTIYGAVGLEDLFESYDDAKFVSDNYCTRTERFEPPLWDEIAGNANYEFTQPNGRLAYICSSMDLGKIYVEILNAFFDSEFHYFEYTKGGYRKAVEYAKKIFLGETK